MMESEFHNRVKRVRRAAQRQGLVLRKVRRRDPLAVDFGHWTLREGRTLVSLPSLDVVETYLSLDSERLASALDMPIPGPRLPVPSVPQGHRKRPAPGSPGRSRAVRELEAVDRMRAAGYEPLTAFPGWVYGWKSRCLRCGELSTPAFRDVVSRRSRGCRHCAPRGRISASRAVAEAAECGYTPEAPYQALDAPWTLRHVPCGQLVELSLRGLRAGAQCPACNP
jgi:hypothetical protein